MLTVRIAAHFGRAPWLRSSWHTLLCIVGCVLLCFSAAAGANGIGVSRAQIEADGDSYQLDSQLQIDLPPALADAVERGVTLDFELVFSLLRPRTFWFDSTIVERREVRSIAFNSLTRSYRVSLGATSETADRLEDALNALAAVRMPRLFLASAVESGRRYRAALRISLDWSHLPKPLQMNALASRAWRVKPGEFEWEFTP